jgi:hypothetical protein
LKISQATVATNCLSLNFDWFGESFEPISEKISNVIEKETFIIEPDEGL